jgi:hypothetical protein
MNRARRAADDFLRLMATPAWWDAAPFAALRPCAVVLDTTAETDPAAVEAAGAAFGARAGWVERQSRLQVFEDGRWPAAEGGFDAVLAGELAGSETGLFIRRAEGGWRLTRIADHPDESGDCLCHDTELAGVDRLPAGGQPFGRRLSYRVYWRYAAERGWRPFAARLLGFREAPSEPAGPAPGWRAPGSA